MSKMLLVLGLLLLGAQTLHAQALSDTSVSGPRVTVRFDHAADNAPISSDSAAVAGGKRVAEGAVLGFTIGAMLGGVISVASGHSDNGLWLIALIGWGAIGAAIGAGIASIR